LLVVLKTFLRVGGVLLKCALTILLSECVQVIAVNEVEIVEIRAVGERVLCEDHVVFSVTGFVEECRNEAARVGSADVNHPRPQRTEDGLSVIQKPLRGPVVRFPGGAPGFLNGTPDLMEVG